MIVWLNDVATRSWRMVFHMWTLVGDFDIDTVPKVPTTDVRVVVVPFGPYLPVR